MNKFRTFLKSKTYEYVLLIWWIGLLIWFIIDMIKEPTKILNYVLVLGALLAILFCVYMIKKNKNDNKVDPH